MGRTRSGSKRWRNRLLAKRVVEDPADIDLGKLASWQNDLWKHEYVFVKLVDESKPHALWRGRSVCLDKGRVSIRKGQLTKLFVLQRASKYGAHRSFPAVGCPIVAHSRAV